MRTFNITVGYVEHPAHFVETRDDVDAFLDWARGKKRLALDTETTGLRPLVNPDFRVRLVQVSDGKQAWLLSNETPAGEAAWQAVRQVLSSLQQLAVFNAPFEAGGLTHAGLIDWDHFWRIQVDCRTMAHLLDARGRRLNGGCPLDLKSLSYYLVENWKLQHVRWRKDSEKKELLTAAKAAVGKHVTAATMWAQIPVDNSAYLAYSARDALWTWKLACVLSPILRTNGFNDLHQRERRFAAIVANMSRLGFEVDEGYTRTVEKVLESELMAMRSEMSERHGAFNPNSVPQVLLKFAEQGLHPVDDQGKPSTARAVLEALPESVLAADLLAYRRENKALTACVRPMLNMVSDRGRLHADFKTLGTITARMSCSDPNLQQMPKRRGAAERLRNCLRADEGKVIVAADLSQVEYRVAAGLSRDPFMLNAFANGIDLHKATAEDLFPGTGCNHDECDHRTFAKNAGFGKIYGAGAATIALQTGSTLETARKVVARYDEVMSGLASWSEGLVEQVNEQLWESDGAEAFVTNLHGRRVQIDPQKAYVAVNYAIQSEARDQLVDWVFNADDAGLLSGSLLAIIHDELVCQADPADAEDLAIELEHAAAVLDVEGVPIAADAKVGTRNWGSLYAKKKDTAPQDEERPDTNPEGA